MSAETLCRASDILRGTEHFAWHWQKARVLVPSNSTSFILLPSLWFRQWRSCADRVVNLNTTTWLPLFGRTWAWARASTHPHVLAWHMGRDYSDCRASELTDRQVSGFIFSWFLENTEKTKVSQETFLRLMPRTGPALRYMICVTLFCMLRESKNIPTCENRTRNTRATCKNVRQYLIPWATAYCTTTKNFQKISRPKLSVQQPAEAAEVLKKQRFAISMMSLDYFLMWWIL